ncbi:hypothetical protein [Candidatus Villigracilis affinis]
MTRFTRNDIPCVAIKYPRDLRAGKERWLNDSAVEMFDESDVS